MKLVIEEAKVAAKFETIFLTLVSLTEFINIQITDCGLWIQGMDQCKICLFDIVLKCEWFTIFETDESDIGNVITLPAKLFYKVLSTYKPDQCLELDFEESHKLSVSFLRGSKSCDKFFVIPTVDIDINFMNIKTEKEYDAEIVITSKKMAELVGQLEIFHDKITFDLSEEHLLLKASGDNGSMTAKLGLDDKQLLDYAIIEDTNINISFKMRYVKIMMSFSKLSEEVKIEISRDKPMVITYCLGEDSELKLVLAPQIEHC